MLDTSVVVAGLVGDIRCNRQRENKGEKKIRAVIVVVFADGASSERFQVRYPPKCPFVVSGRCSVL